MAEVCTVGHSTRSLKELVEVLKAHGIRRLLDVRSIPRSRRNPQFNRGPFGRALRAKGIACRWFPILGGRRRVNRASTLNAAWRNDAFRGYADYMQTPEFEKGLRELIRLARDRRTAIMCAEAVPWRCHRSLIADALDARGVRVLHLFSPTNARPHRRTKMARVRRGKVVYPAA